MKKMAIVASVLTLLTATNATAEVTSVSAEKFNNVEGLRFWEVTLNCANSALNTTMIRNVGRDERWCAANDTALCDESKLSLSNTICKNDANLVNTVTVVNNVPMATQPAIAEKVTTKALASNTTASTNPLASGTEIRDSNVDAAARRNELLREQVNIEEQRIILEQRRLELIQTELRLKQRP